MKAYQTLMRSERSLALTRTLLLYFADQGEAPAAYLNEVFMDEVSLISHSQELILFYPLCRRVAVSYLALPAAFGVYSP